MGHYADEKTRLVGNQTIWQLRADLLDPSCSSKTIVIKKNADDDTVYIDTGQPDYVNETPRDTSGDTTLHTYTGTGGGKAAIENWRAANSSATSGDMYDFWSSYIVNMNDDARAAARVLDVAQVTDLTNDIAHLQKIIDNGEDTTNIS